MVKTLVLELLRTKRRRSTKTTLKKIREIDVNGIPTVFDEGSVVLHIAGLLVVACLVGDLTYYLPLHGRSATHFFLLRLLLRFMQVQFDLTQRDLTERNILTNGGLDCFFFAFYCTRRSITMFKTARQLPLPRAKKSIPQPHTVLF
jgi:hypothetical protein